MTCPSPKPSPKRNAILDAAREMFLEVGYACASMDAVAARAGVSKATIYAHFSSKDQLFRAVIRQRCEQHSTFAAVDPSIGGRATLTLIGRRLLEMLLLPETLAMFRLVMAEAVRQPDLARAFYESGPGAGKVDLARVIADLADRGEMRTIDPLRLADLFLGMLRTHLFMRTILGLCQPESDEIDRTVASAVETLMAAYGADR